MGSASIDSCSDNTINGQQMYDDVPKRPVFYPCEVCGRKFTMRAMVVHKSSCSETEGCRCLVCKIGKKKIKWENEESKSDNDPDTVYRKRSSLKTDPDALLKPHSRNPLNGKPITNGAIADDTNVISFKLVENHIIDKMVGYSSSDRNEEDFAGKFKQSPTYDDHKYISMQAESSDNSNTVDEKPPLSTDQFSMFMKMNDKVDHECSRKIYCSVCDEHVYWESFAPHLIQHCKVINDNMLMCPGCDRVFNKPAYILTHFIVHILKHPEHCSVCRCGDPNCVDARDRALAEHCYADSSLYYCYICLTRFSHNQTVSNHMRLHTNEMPFTCTECNRSFRQIGNLQRHMTTHRGDRPHKCPDCCRSFADPATLRNHLRVHTGETPFVCSICKRGFSQVGNLKRHMALHLPKDALASIESVADENAILVNNPEEEVAKMSPSPSMVGTPSPLENNNIEQHSPSDLNVSNNVDCSSDVAETNGKVKRKKKNQKMKVFTCEICKKVYAWHHDLVVHFRTHTGEKPFECDICGRRFAQSGAVRIHKDRHHPDSINNEQESS